MQINKRLVCYIWIVITTAVLLAAQDAVEMTADPFKLVIYPKTGNFCLYRLNLLNNGTYTPLFDDRSYSSDNIYSVKFNEQMYHLNNKSGKKIIIEQLKNEIIITFQISFDFIATQRFTFVNTSAVTTGPILKITTEIQNISGEIADIALKAVFDCNLSEKNLIPMYTDIRSEIGSELMLQPVIEKDTVLFSADQGYACLFFLKNEHMDTPFSVFIANWQRLITKTWLPTYEHGRSFRKSKTADPGILYVWSNRKVPNRQTFSVSNCIGFYDYRDHTSVQLQKPPVKQTSSDLKKENKSEPAKENYDHIEELLKRIHELKNASPDTVSQAELDALQAEVDKAINMLQEK